MRRIRVKGTGKKSKNNPWTEPDFYALDALRPLPEASFGRMSKQQQLQICSTTSTSVSTSVYQDSADVRSSNTFAYEMSSRGQQQPLPSSRGSLHEFKNRSTATSPSSSIEDEPDSDDENDHSFIDRSDYDIDEILREELRGFNDDYDIDHDGASRGKQHMNETCALNSQLHRLDLAIRKSHDSRTRLMHAGLLDGKAFQL